MRSILLVCPANICRSPMAEGVLRKMLADAGMESRFEIDSVGTHDYHVGKPPFVMAVEAARRPGYDIKHLVSRRISPDDFAHFDSIPAMYSPNMASPTTTPSTNSKQKPQF